MRTPVPCLTFSVISTFSGCGGSCLGYRVAGGKIHLAVEWNKAAAAIYSLNFPGTPRHVGAAHVRDTILRRETDA